MTLFHFNTQSDWIVLDDAVMGGGCPGSSARPLKAMDFLKVAFPWKTAAGFHR